MNIVMQTNLSKSALESAMMFIKYYAIAFCLIFVSMSSAIWMESAHHDNTRYFRGDTSEVFKSNCRNDGQYGWLQLIGRPVTAEIECKVFQKTKTLQDLSEIRVLVVGLMALGAALLGFICFSYGLNRLTSFLICISVFTLPGMQNAVIMTNIPNAVTPALALLSFFVLSGIHKLDLQSGIKISLSITLLVFVGLTYPAMAFIYFSGWIIRSLLDTKLPVRSQIKQTAFELAVFGFSMVLAIFIGKALLDPLLAERLATLPDGFKADFSPFSVFNKIPFVLTEALPAAASLWFFNNHSSGVVSAVVIASVLIIFLVDHARTDLRRSLYLGVLIAFTLSLAFAPLFLSKATNLHQRVLFVPEAFLLLAGSLGLYRIINAKTNHEKLSYFSHAPYFLIASLGILYSSYTTASSVWGTNIEMNFVRVQFAAHNNNPRRIHLVRAEDNGTGFNRKKSATDEFNRKTTDFKQDIVDFLRLSLYGSSNSTNERQLSFCNPVTTDCEMVVPISNIIVSYSDYKETFCKTSDMLLIDMNVLVRATNSGRPELVSEKDLPDCAISKFRVSAESLPGEQYSASKAFDNSVSVNDFWETSISNPVTLSINYNEPTALIGYRFSGGEDSSRMPRSWSLFGLGKTGSWRLLDQRIDQPAFLRNQSRDYSVENSDSYKSYRFVFKDAGAEKILRIYEIHLDTK